jgi:hypothetical protein
MSHLRIGAAGFGAAIMLIVSACTTGGSRPSAASVPIYPGFDGYHRTVTTRSPDAQRWFD